MFRKTIHRVLTGLAIVASFGIGDLAQATTPTASASPGATRSRIRDLTVRTRTDRTRRDRTTNRTTDRENTTTVRDRTDKNGGDVIHVKGYRRKDGTWVKPYTRRKPKTSPSAAH